MDATHNQAVLGISIAGTPGFQFLDLATSTFGSTIASGSTQISEDVLIDPIRNLVLSPAENGNYEIVDISSGTASPTFFEHDVNTATERYELDSAGEDCTTGIILAPAEFSGPSAIFIADLNQATYTAGSPGTWAAPSQVQFLTDSFLAAGASGIAVAQGTHTGVVSGEFGGDQITAIALPTTLGTGGTIPSISDWVSCSIGGGFSNGYDPHTVTAYQSPNSGHAIAVLANGGATQLAVVDLKLMLDTTVVPRTGGRCTSGSLPSTVVSFVAVP
jgi:hypothetical protein